MSSSIVGWENAPAIDRPIPTVEYCVDINLATTCSHSLYQKSLLSDLSLSYSTKKKHPWLTLIILYNIDGALILLL